MRIRNLLMMVVLFCGMVLPEGVLFGAPYLKQRLQPEIIWGHFCLTLPRGRTGTVNVSRQGKFPLHFQLTAGNGGMANAEYRYSGSQEFVLLSIQNGFSLLNFRALPDENTYVLLLQDRDGKKIHLETGTLSDTMKTCLKRDLQEKIQTEELHGENVRSWQADSFWELLFCRPDECREALNAIFSIYGDPTEMMKDFSGAFTSTLIQREMESRPPQTVHSKSASPIDPVSAHPQMDPEKTEAQIRELLLQLDSDKFSVRRRADEELRGYGIGLFLNLGNISHGELSPEARFRLTRILEYVEKNVKLSRENFLHDVQFWTAKPSAWTAVLEFGTPEQQDLAWEILKENRSRFFSASEKPEEVLDQVFQHETFSALSEETRQAVVHQFKDLIFSVSH